MKEKKRKKLVWEKYTKTCCVAVLLLPPTAAYSNNKTIMYVRSALVFCVRTAHKESIRCENKLALKTFEVHWFLLLLMLLLCMKKQIQNSNSFFFLIIGMTGNERLKEFDAS